MDSPLRYLLWILMVVVGALLALAVAYLVRGSLEAFPTAEQQDKVRTVAGVLVAMLAVAEFALWWLLRRLDRADGSQTPARRAV